MSAGPDVMESLPSIDQPEFDARARKAAEMVREAGLDALLVHSNDGEMANVRYFSDYWPVFESAGVLVPASGEPALLIGPEAETFARSRSRIPRIYKLLEYREPADPEYPDIAVSTFRDVFERHCERRPKRIGIGGWAVLPLPVWEGLKAAWPEAEIVRADDIMRRLRCVKSPAELACLAAAFRIAEQALGAVIDAMHPGTTELELVGVAQKEIYTAGAEYEGMPQYVLSGANSTHAVSRASSRRIQAGEVVQLNISARVSGYSSGVGRPVCLGAMPGPVRELVGFGLLAHRWTIDHLRPRVPAAEIARGYGAWVRHQGYSEYMLYGPCHGLGITEVEPPWIETTSCYDLAPGMTFQADNFFYTPERSRLAENGCFGLRWEDGVVLTEDGNMPLSRHRWECIEIT